jgi:biopolymer transport protein ExbD
VSVVTPIQRQVRFAPALTNEINVTPMIDVLLVLLIIFMAAIPSMRKSIDVQVPDRRAQPPAEGTPSIVLELDATGRYAINGSPVTHDELAVRLHAIYDERPEKVLFVKGSGRLKYGEVVAAMDVARGAGVKVLGIP